MSLKIVLFLTSLIFSQINIFANYPGVEDSFYIRLANEQKITGAIEKGNTYKISRYINSGLDVNNRILGGTTLLVEAIKDKQLAIVNLLLQSGADPNMRTTEFKDENENWIPEDSPLEAAIVYDSNYVTAKLLLKYGANINDTDIFYGTVLHEVIRGKGDEMYRGLYTENGDSTKFKVNQNEAMKKVLWLIKNGANVNAKNSFGDPPLYDAISFRFDDIAEVLIEKGAAINIAGNDGKTILHHAESPGLLRKLIKKGGDVNAKGDDGLTPLHMAVFSNNYEKVKILVENNADVNIKDYDSHLTPLGWLIIDSFDSDIAKLLITHGAEIPQDLVIQYGLKDLFEKINKELKR